MKRFDFNQSSEQKILQQQLAMVTLKKFAELSLLDCQQEKDLYLSDCLAAVAKIDFNSINGGIYFAEKDRLIMSLEDNSLFAEFSLAAGLTFFNGELTYLANQTISAMVANLYDPQEKLFFQQLSYSINEAPFILDEAIVKNVLTEDELELLNALIAKPNNSANSRYRISYKRSIIQASADVDYFPKRAQILEHSLRSKLCDYQASYPKACKLSNNFCLSANARVLSVLIQAIIWHKQDEYRDVAADLHECLLKIFKSELKLTEKQSIDMLAALLDYLQIDFDPLLAEYLTVKIRTLKDVESLNQSYHNKLDLICSFLNQIPGNNPNLNGKTKTQGSTFVEKINLVKLSGTILQQDNIKRGNIKQELLACYNPYVKFITID